MTAPGYEDFSADSGWMENFGCVEIVREELLSGDKARTQWDSLMARIQFGDTVVIPKLSNALRGARQLVFFLEFCRLMNIRLVSIHDRIDSGNELFPETRTSDVLTAIALLPKEANAIRKSSRHKSRIKKHIESISDKAMCRAERNKRVVNMYLEGFPIDEIFKKSGFRSRSSVFRILNEANVELDRGRWKGPLGPRMKTGIKGLHPCPGKPDTVRPATGVAGYGYKRIPATEGKGAGHPRTSRHLVSVIRDYPVTSFISWLLQNSSYSFLLSPRSMWRSISSPSSSKHTSSLISRVSFSLF